MTNPLAGSTGNKAIGVQSLEQSSNGKQQGVKGEAGDNGNDNDFGKLVRQLGSEPKATREGKQQAAQGSKENSAGINAKPVRTGSTSIAGKLANSQDLATNEPETDEAASSLEGKTAVSVDADGEIPPTLIDRDGKNTAPANGADELKAEEETDGSVQRPSQPTADSLAEPELVDMKAQDQEKLSDDAEDDAQGDEQVALRESDPDIAADDVPEDDGSVVAAAETSVETAPEDAVKAAETGLVSGVNSAIANPTNVDTSQEPGESSQRAETIVPRLGDGPRTGSPVRPDLAPDKAPQASLDGAMPELGPKDQADRTLAANERVMSELSGRANKNPSSSGLPLDNVAKQSAETNVAPQLQSQIRLVDGQPRTLRSGSALQPAVSDAGEEQAAERPSTISGAGLGAASTDLAKLLNERRIADSASTNGLQKPVTNNAASPEATGLALGDDESSEGRLPGVARDDALQARSTSQVGIQADRSMLETAMSVSRQLSQGVAGNLSMLLNSGSASAQAGTSTSSLSEFMSGRGLPSDLDVRLNVPAPGSMRSLQLQLQPVSLGTVTAHLTMKNDELHVRFVVEKAETNELIQSQRNLLLAQLVEAGVEVSAANVEVETAKVTTARSTSFAGGEFGSYGDLTGGGYGSTDSQNRRTDSERDGVIDQAPFDEEGAAGEVAGLANQRPSVVYL